MSTSVADFFAHVGAVVTGVVPVAYLVFRKLKGLIAMSPAAAQAVHDLDVAVDAVVAKVQASSAATEAAALAGAAQAESDMLAAIAPSIAKLQALVPSAPVADPSAPASPAS